MNCAGYSKALVWFRRDLRDFDHAALAAALRAAGEVYCAFVFDRSILDALPSRCDRRVHFIRASLIELDAALRTRGGGVIVRHGDPVEEIPRLAVELGVGAVFANRDYEPAAKARDASVAVALAATGIALVTGKDQAVFDGDEVLSQAGRPYTVFTPYSRSWLARLGERGCSAQASDGRLAAPPPGARVPEWSDLGFQPTDLAATGVVPGMSGAQTTWEDFRGRLARYAERRDYPGQKGCSGLSVHLRFGTLSVRQLVQAAVLAGGAGAEAWLKELIWRDFYFMILDRFPHVVTQPFKGEYDHLVWDDWPEGFAAWCGGRTGYPLVDAAMRQLNSSGTMHNRLRMVTASFLTKDLGIDWRLGERYFADRLNDFDLAANNGGWQWAASTGCDAQPWFRIFNPVTQSEKFDPAGAFIRRYLPELKQVPDRHLHAPWRMSAADQQAAGFRPGRDYPLPIVDHESARRRTLARYGAVRPAVCP